MRKVFAGLMAVLMLAVVVQFFLAASGAFDNAPNDESFGPHRGLGFLILFLALLATGAGAAARMPGRIVARAGLVLGLVVLQPVIAGIAGAVGEVDGASSAGELVFGLHGVNGLVIMALVATIVRTSRAPSPDPDEQPEVPASPVPRAVAPGS
jgi:heme A synthase